MSIDYFGILKRAAKIIWKNKFLWIFGFFAGAASGFNFNSGINLNLPLRQEQAQPKKWQGEFEQFSSQAFGFLQNNWIWIALASLLILLLVLVFIVLAVISRGALIACVNKLEKGEETSFKQGFRLGLSYFWKIFGLGIITSLIIFLSFLFLAFPVILLFVYKMWVRAIALLLLALIIFIPLIIVISFITLYGSRYIVLRNQKIIPSIKSAFELLQNNLFPSLLFGLILMGINFCFGIFLFFIFIIIALPFVLLGIIFYLLLGGVGAIIVAGLGILTFVILVLILSAILSSFNSAVWTLAFRKLA